MSESPGNKERVLVLDGDHKNALAIVRHLGRSRRYTIDVVAHGKASVALFSRYVAGKYLLPDPKKAPGPYMEGVLELLRANRYRALIPVSYISFQLCSASASAIRALTRLVIADAGAIALASDKLATYRFAGELGVPVPKTIEIGDAREVENVDMEYPCVIKAPFEMGKNVVEYVRDKEELTREYARLCRRHAFQGRLPVIQQYVSGGGFGFFAFYRGGECQAYFAHRRLREYPVTGGASTAAESFFDETLVASGKKILDALRWEGVAMVEFKQDEATGTYYLMEINAKFWGSLDLALVSGVDFPRMMIDASPGGQPPFKTGTRFQWILNGELFHVIERPGHLFAFARDLFRAKNDVWLRDLKPNLFQLAYIPVYYYKKLFK